MPGPLGVRRLRDPEEADRGARQHTGRRKLSDSVKGSLGGARPGSGDRRLGRAGNLDTALPPSACAHFNLSSPPVPGSRRVTARGVFHFMDAPAVNRVTFLVDGFNLHYIG